MVSTALAEKPNILIVDDKRENLLALESLLETKETNILKASSGNEALAQLLEHDCAVTLLDVQMPDMDGFETAALIRQNRKTRNVPIIFVTAINKEEKYVFRGYELGAVDYLFKPLQPTVVQAKVNAFIEQYKQKQELNTKAVELENLNATLCQVNSKLDMSLRELRILNEDLERFASIASHDLKEPLRTIRSFLQLLERKIEGKLDSEAKDYLQFVLNGASRMNLLVEDLLKYTRAGATQLNLQAIESHEVLESAIQNLALLIEESKGKVERGTLPNVFGDRTQLIQLFQNLLNNAIKFRGDKEPGIRIHAIDRGNEWEFVFEDNGMGIAQADQEKIFALFHRLHSKSEIDGSGIGLAVCKRIVERHGGKIWVESQPGMGAAFHFTISKSERPSISVTSKIP